MSQDNTIIDYSHSPFFMHCMFYYMTAFCKELVQQELFTFIRLLSLNIIVSDILQCHVTVAPDKGMHISYFLNVLKAKKPKRRQLLVVNYCVHYHFVDSLACEEPLECCENVQCNYSQQIWHFHLQAY